MRRHVLEKIKDSWSDTSETEFNLTLDEVDHLNDLELFAFFVQFITNDLAIQNDTYKEELKRLYGVDRPFICGSVGGKESDSMPAYVIVSPSYGDKGFAIYKKHQNYTELGS